MESYIVYPVGHRPWPNEVRLLTFLELQQYVVNEAMNKLQKTLSYDEVKRIAELVGLEVEDRT